MKLTPAERQGSSSAAIAPTLWLITAFSGLLLFSAYAADPAWWSSSGAVRTPEITTNSGVVTTNYVRDDYAAVTQGQLKQFTARAVDEINAEGGGASDDLANLVTGWQADYATNNYSAGSNPYAPYKPSDFDAMTVGQLKYVGNLLWSNLVSAEYTNAVPSWLALNTNTDASVANIGQLKQVFDFDLTGYAPDVLDLNATAGVGEIDLSWINPTGNWVTDIQVQVEVGGVWETVATLDPTTTSYALAAAAGSSPTVRVVDENADAPGGPQLSAGASPGTTPTSRPPPLYAVVDLGSNINPVKITNSGHILYGTSMNTYGVWFGQTNVALVPQSPGDVYEVNDISEDGTVIGSEYTSQWKSAQWFTSNVASGSTVSPILTAASGGTNAAARGIALSATNVPWTFVGKTLTNASPAYSTWVEDGYRNATELGTATVNSSGHNIGISVHPVAVNNQGDMISYNYDSYYSTNSVLSAYTAHGYSGTVTTYSSSPGSGHSVLSSYPVDIGNEVGGDVFVVSQVQSGLSTWWRANENGTGHTFSGLTHPPSVNGAANSAGNPAVQIVSGDNIWTYDPTASLLSASQSLSSLIPLGPWSSVSAGNYPSPNSRGHSINDSGAIVGTATYSGTDPTIAAGSHGILLLPGELGVDANRDGTIVLANDAGNPANVDPTTGNPLPVDTTSQAAPFRFWVNDGQNTGEDQAPLTGSQITTANDTLGSINFKGDLENFARLWIYTKGLNQAIHDGSIKLGLKWENTTGSPSINVYKAYESNGGSQYLSSDTIAAQQIAGSYGTAIAQVMGTSTVVLPTSLFGNLSETSPKTYLLFEGTHAGVGKLTLVYLKSDGVTKIGEGGQVYMSLKTVTDMFEQAQVTPPGQTDIANPYSFPANGNWSSSTPTNDTNGPPSYAAGTTPGVSWNDTTSSNFEHPTDETKQFLLFVHGWNVTNGRYTQQSGECFKRLWWQGYKGIFAAIRWPGDLTGADQSSWWTTVANALDYFEIEYRAFKYGQAVKQYTDHFNTVGYTVGVVGHSMGNIVSSEALKSGGNFTYVLMDGAVSARCYDTSSSLLLTGVTFNPPDLSSSGGYGSYFSGLSGGPTSFYNSQDPALQAWATGNVLLKGETDANGVSYVFTGGVGVQLKYTLGDAHPESYYRDVYANGVTNTHESMTMYAVTRTAAVGIESVGGSVSSLDMQTDFPGAASHSPQFDYNIQHGPMTFYKKVLSGLDFPLNP